MSEYRNKLRQAVADLPSTAIICNFSDMPHGSNNQNKGLVAIKGVGDCQYKDGITVSYYDGSKGYSNIPCTRETNLDDVCVLSQDGYSNVHSGIITLEVKCKDTVMTQADLKVFESVGGSSTVKITYAIPQSQIPESAHVREFSCPLISEDFEGADTGRMMATETFAAGTDINLYSFRYPVNFFCNRHPVIVTSGVDGASFNDFSVYQKIVNGEDFVVPATQTYTFFYVIYSNQQLPIVCKTGVYDSSKKECVWTPGIVHVCSQGQFDQALGLCVVQPESTIVCPNGGRYVVQTGLCEWNPPLQAICPDQDNDGKPDGIYNPDTLKCQYTPPTAYSCLSSAYTYNSETKKCEIYPEKTIVCPGNYIYNAKNDKCERSATTTESCVGGGTYNPTTKKCEIVITDISEVCPKGILDENRTICVFNPDVENYCPQGSYDAEGDKCVITPDLQYLCLIGDYDEERGTCTISPEEVISCREGYEYDAETDKCTRAAEEAGLFVDVWDWLNEIFASLFSVFQ
jgi:hypothetical protein